MTPETMAEQEREALAEALYADGKLGPGYMFYEDCEHLASRFLASPWLAALIAEAKAEVLREAADAAVPRFMAHPQNRSNTVADWLRARAEHITPTTGGASSRS